MKKAQSMIEVSLILVLVVVVSLALWSMFNNQKMKLANTSASTLTQSGTINKTKKEALELANALGLDVNNYITFADILRAIGGEIANLRLNANMDKSELAKIDAFNNTYVSILNELGKALTASDNTTVQSKVADLAKKIGVTINKNDEIGDILSKIDNELPQLAPSVSTKDIKNYNAQYNDIVSVLTISTARPDATGVRAHTDINYSPQSNPMPVDTSGISSDKIFINDDTVPVESTSNDTPIDATGNNTP